MSQVKLKLTDDFNNFLGLMLVAYWQLDMRYIYTPNCSSVVIQLNQLKGTEIKNGNTNRNKLGLPLKPLYGEFIFNIRVLSSLLCP